MGPDILKVEEINRLGVISLPFTAELLEDTHMELWESAHKGGEEAVEAGPFDAM